MSLLSTLRYGVTLPQPAGTGNYGGDLHLFFSSLNPQDYIQSGPTPKWNNWHIDDVYQLPNGTVTLQLNVVQDTGGPLELVMLGDMEVQTTGGPGFSTQEIGQEGTTFTPGNPVITVFHGSRLGTVSGVNFNLGFEIVAAWDGISADCHGSWWAIWK